MVLDREGFDLWANNYDKTVNLSEEANTYPFCGYKNVLGYIYETIHKSHAKTILDIGFGTGVLTQKLYDEGYSITGIDFSSKMIEIAKKKMPAATLLQYDFSKGLPDELSDNKFDFIISTYAIHHLSNEYKAEFINLLLNHLSLNGCILIGDILFETQSDLEFCKTNNGDGWDNDEIYVVFNDLKQHFSAAIFHKFSFCAGVVHLENEHLLKHAGTVELSTDRLLLRRFTEDDVEATFCNWTSDKKVTEFLRWPTHDSVAVTQRVISEWITNYQNKNYYQWAIVLKDDGADKPFGTISVVGQNENLRIMRIGYCIGTKWWNQGIVTEAFKAIIPFLFDKVHVNRIEAQHDPQNPNSGKVMLKCGLQYEGTLRQADSSNKGIVDAAMYSLLARDYYNLA